MKLGWSLTVAAVIVVWVFVLAHIMPHQRRSARTAFEERGCYLIIPEVGLARCTR